MALDMIDGTTKHREKSYPIDNNGLFVIITNKTFEYKISSQSDKGTSQKALFPKECFKYRWAEDGEESGEDEYDSAGHSSDGNNHDAGHSCEENVSTDGNTDEDNSNDIAADGQTDSKSSLKGHISAPDEGNSESSRPSTPEDNTAIVEIASHSDIPGQGGTSSDCTGSPGADEVEPADINGNCSQNQENTKNTDNGKVVEDETSKKNKKLFIIDKFKETFKLNDDSKNLIEWDDKMSMSTTCGREVESSKKKPFVTFIKKIGRKMEKKNLLDGNNKPSFLMLVLLSAGKKFGEFLLRGDDQDQCEGCVGADHGRTSTCNVRRVSDLVRAVQEAEYTSESGKKTALFFGIPKIFLVQTISGKEGLKSRDKSAIPKPPVKAVKADDYIPRGSDTFVFYAHIEQSCRWLEDNDFYLLDKFCESIRGLKCDIAEKNAMLRDLYRFLCDHDEKSKPSAVLGEEFGIDDTLLEKINGVLVKEYDPLQIQRESLCDGWLDNLCTTTAAQISHFLFRNCKLDRNKKSADYNHMRAHMSSTMRFRLSIMDMLLKCQGQ